MSIHQPRAEILENVPLARDTFRVRIATPEIARAIKPGQFVMLRIPKTTDPLLGRPFALYDTVLDDEGYPIGIDVVYLVVGKMTSLLAEAKSGEMLEIWGPLGNGFLPMDRQEHVIFVAGGIGQTPFLAYARSLLGERGYGAKPSRRTAERISLYYGVRTAELAAGVDDFRAAGVDVHLASDDGTLGYHGFITGLLREHQPCGPIVTCGPESMMHAVAQIANEWNLPCQVSLETPMACGIGACFSCVTQVNTAEGWDYKRVCVDGPVFDARTLHWGE